MLQIILLEIIQGYFVAYVARKRIETYILYYQKMNIDKIVYKSNDE